MQENVHKQLELVAKYSEEQLENFSREEWIKLLNELITHHFQGYIYLLYRLDISEKKLKAALQAHQKEAAAAVTADLIVERLAQKKATKAAFSNAFAQPDANFKEERW